MTNPKRGLDRLVTGVMGLVGGGAMIAAGVWLFLSGDPPSENPDQVLTALRLAGGGLAFFGLLILLGGIVAALESSDEPTPPAPRAEVWGEERCYPPDYALQNGLPGLKRAFVSSFPDTPEGLKSARECADEWLAGEPTPYGSMMMGATLFNRTPPYEFWYRSQVSIRHSRSDWYEKKRKPPKDWVNSYDNPPSQFRPPTLPF